MLFLWRRLRGSPSQRTEGTRAPLFPRFPNGRRRCATHAHRAGRGGRLRCVRRGAVPARRCHAAPLRARTAGAVGMEILARPRAGFLHELPRVLKEQAAEAKKSHFGKEIGECLRCAPRCSAPRPALRTAVAVCHGALQPCGGGSWRNCLWCWRNRRGPSLRVWMEFLLSWYRYGSV